jgi:hypothetical protein
MLNCCNCQQTSVRVGPINAYQCRDGHFRHFCAGCLEEEKRQEARDPLQSRPAEVFFTTDTMIPLVAMWEDDDGITQVRGFSDDFTHTFPTKEKATHYLKTLVLQVTTEFRGDPS